MSRKFLLQPSQGTHEKAGISMASQSAQKEWDWKVVEFTQSARRKGKVVESKKHKKSGIMDNRLEIRMHTPDSGKFSILGDTGQGNTRAVE